jgi:hypothetical protein
MVCNGDYKMHSCQECKTLNIPLQHNPNNLPSGSPNACADIPDDKILPSYQHLVGSITYLAICTRPDIAYAAMALGQFNSSPTRAHLACAKGVLRYLAGTVHLSLQFPSPRRLLLMVHQPSPLRVASLTQTGPQMKRIERASQDTVSTFLTLWCPGPPGNNGPSLHPLRSRSTMH